jgi:hypothetical protein
MVDLPGRLVGNRASYVVEIPFNIPLAALSGRAAAVGQIIFCGYANGLSAY